MQMTHHLCIFRGQLSEDVLILTRKKIFFRSLEKVTKRKLTSVDSLNKVRR